MFDAINGPANEFQGPSTGHSTENGDSWHTAVSKLNGNFERLAEAIAGGGFDAADQHARAMLKEMGANIEAMASAHEAAMIEFGAAVRELTSRLDALTPAQEGPVPQDVPPAPPAEQGSMGSSA